MYLSNLNTNTHFLESRMSSSLSQIAEKSLFSSKNGGLPNNLKIIKHRFLSFLIWQSIPTTLLFIFFKASIFTFSSISCLSFFITFVPFHFSFLLYSVFLFSISSPQFKPSASLWDIFMGAARVLFISNSRPLPPDYRHRLRLLMSFVVFVVVGGVLGGVALVSLCWGCATSGDLACRGFGSALLYAFHYVYRQRWVLQFPIVQRPPYFSFKKGIPLAIQQALQLSAAGYLFSSMLMFMLPKLRTQFAVGNFIGEQLAFSVGGFVVFLGWELNHHLHQVLNTKRFVFAPPKGSAAAETNPSEPLLAVLDESTQKSLLQYLAHLDLCMVCERNVDTWRRAAFFEETGETYKRVVASCIRPIEQLTLKLSEHLEISSVDHPYQLSLQLRSSGEGLADSSMLEAFYDFQLSVWCARTLASLTAHSHKEDRFGVAQLSGSNADVISTLMSALLAVETLMGKKTHLQSPNLIGPAGIKWATVNTGSRDSATNYSLKRRDSPLYAKAYSVADTLRTSIYEIVSVFHAEMLSSEKAGFLEKDWTSSSKPPYGTREILSQKLRLFLNFQAC